MRKAINSWNDSRFKYLEKENSGVSDTRNYGLKNASGKYIWFVDADDVVKNNDTLNRLYDEINNNDLDVLEFNYLFNNNKAINDRYKGKILNGLDMIDDSLKENIFHSYVWHYLFSKKFINDNNIIFDTEINNAEDLKFTMSVLFKAKRVMYIDYVAYNYVNYSDSLSHSLKNQKNNMLDYISIMLFLKNEKISSYRFQSYINNNLFKIIIKGIAVENFHIDKKRLKKLIDIKFLERKMKIVYILMVITPNFINKYLCNIIYKIYYYS